MNRRRFSPAALRFADRRKREDEAPRLRDAVQDLVGLVLEIEDSSGDAVTKHVRRVQVDQAPALFLVPCVDPRCVDGEHDLTYEVMRSLRAHETKFEGKDECRGSLGPSPCPRIVRFEAVARYAP